jgi:hypothetical protein
MNLIHAAFTLLMSYGVAEHVSPGKIIISSNQGRIGMVVTLCLPFITRFTGTHKALETGRALPAAAPAAQLIVVGICCNSRSTFRPIVTISALLASLPALPDLGLTLLLQVSSDHRSCH